MGNLVVLNHATKEVLTAARTASMLSANVDTLLQDTITNTLVHFNTNSARGYVEYATSASVVELVRHTLVDRTIANNINKLPNLCQSFGLLLLNTEHQKCTTLQ
jgi:hypothetical protein